MTALDMFMGLWCFRRAARAAAAAAASLGAAPLPAHRRRRRSRTKRRRRMIGRCTSSALVAEISRAREQTDKRTETRMLKDTGEEGDGGVVVGVEWGGDCPSYSLRSLRAFLWLLGAEFLHYPGMMAEAGTPTHASRSRPVTRCLVLPSGGRLTQCGEVG